MKTNHVMKLSAAYAIVLSLVLITSVAILLRALDQSSPVLPDVQTEHVYIYINNDESETAIETESSPAGGWIVKEYEGQIGIFLEDGTLIRVLDTYVKTLPETDRRLLEEGIYADTEDKLRSLMEDYTE